VLQPTAPFPTFHQHQDNVQVSTSATFFDRPVALPIILTTFVPAAITTGHISATGPISICLYVLAHTHHSSCSSIRFAFGNAFIMCNSPWVWYLFLPFLGSCRVVLTFKFVENRTWNRSEDSLRGANVMAYQNIVNI